MHVDCIVIAPFVKYRQVPQVQTVQETVEVLQVQYNDEVGDVLVVRHGQVSQVLKTREVPQIQEVPQVLETREVPQVQDVDTIGDVSVRKKVQAPQRQKVQKTLREPGAVEHVDRVSDGPFVRHGQVP